MLAKLRRETRDCRTSARLTELTGRAAGPLADAARITAETTAERDRRERDWRQAAQQRADDARAAAAAAERAKAHQRAAHTARQKELAQVTGQARQIERLYRRAATKPGESPLAILWTLGVVYYVPPPATAEPSGRVARAMARGSLGVPQGRWRVRGDDAAAFPGRERACPALSQWGDGTRAALTPALAYLHAWEDKLCAQLGKEPRRDRPQLTSPKPALAQVRAAITSG